MMKPYLSILAVVVILIAGCKKDRYEKMYPSVGAVSNIDITIVDSNSNEPIEGIPVNLSVYREFGDYQMFGPFNSDKSGQSKATVNLDRKSDSIIFVVNIATKPFQNEWPKVWDSTKTAFKYTYFEKVGNNENLDFKQTVKLSPLGFLRFKVSGNSAKSDSIIVKTAYETYIIRNLKANAISKTFKLLPSQNHKMTLDFYSKGNKTTYNKDIYVPNAYNVPKGTIYTYELK